MNSRVMFRLGLSMVLVGAVFALTGTSGVLHLQDIGPAYPGVFRYVAEALQEVLYIGGLFMVIASMMVRHFEVLKDEVRQSVEPEASA